jgi:NADH oxidase (H2O2-forming)
VELADEISKIKGINVYLVEMLPELLANSFDIEFSKIAEEVLKSNGVKILTNTKVEEISGKEKVEIIRFSDGTQIETDLMLMGTGGIPNSKIASEAGLNLGKGKGIWVDEYMRTNDPDILAVGDCALKRDFYTHKETPVMLASTATAEARIAGANLYNLKVVRENKGTIEIYSTCIDGKVLGSAGLTEKTAKKEGFEILTGNSEAIDKHPATIPGASKIKVKLIFAKNSGIILGGQVAGGVSCGELINLIGVAIQKRMSFAELETLQMATHPLLTSAPTVYPIVLAAQDAAGKM